MSSDLTIQGEVIVSTEKADSAFDRLGDKAAKMATDVASAAGKAGQAVDSIGAGAEQNAERFTRAETRMRDSIKRSTQELQLLGKTASEKFEFNIQAKGLDPAKFAPWLAEMKQVEAANRAASGTIDNMGMSAKATAAAMRSLPAQFSDIVTSLQGGQAPITVLLQQGGQLKDMFGGAGNAARALGSYMVGLATNPFVLATAGAAALGYAAYSASKDTRELRDAVILTGGAAGLTGGQLLSMAGHVGLNAAALAEFAKSGAVGADAMERITLAAIRFERLGGAAVSETVKQFEALKKSPVEASIALNEKTNYLTASIYAQIKALEEQGRHIDAVKVAQDAYSQAQSRMADSVEAGLGPVDRMWLSIRQNAEGAWKAAKGFAGGEMPLPDRVSAQKKIVADLEASLKKPTAIAINNGDMSTVRERLDIEKKRLFILQSSASAEAGAAADRAKDNALQKAQMAWADQLDATRPNLISTPGRLSKKDTEALAAYNRGVDAKAPPDEIQNQIALVLQKYDTGASIAAVKRAEDDKLAIIARAQDQINTLRATGNLTEIAAIEATNAQVLKAADARIAALQQERKLVGGRQNSEAELVALDTQIAAAKQERYTKEVAGINAIVIAKKKQEDAILAVQIAERNELADALAAQDREWAANAARFDYFRQDQADALRDSNAMLTAEVALLGASDQAREIELSQMRIKLDLARQIEAINRTAMTPEKREELIGKATIFAAEKSAAVSTELTTRYWMSTIDGIRDGMTDGIIAGIKNGGVQGAIRGLGASIENEFDNLVLRPTIQAVMAPVAQGIAGAFGIGPGGSPASGVGAAANGLNLMSGASSFASLFSPSGVLGGVSTALTGFSNAAIASTQSMLGITGTQAQMATSLTNAGYLGTSSTAASIGSAVGAIAPYAIAAMVIKGLSDYTVTSDGGALVANASSKGVGNVANRSDFTQSSSGIFSGGTTHNSSWSDAGAGVTGYMDALVKTATEGAKHYAAALGLSVDAVDGFAQQIEISITGLNPDQQKAAIDKAIGKFMDDMVGAVYGDQIAGLSKSGETSSQTLQRIATDLTTVNSGLDMLGMHLLPIGINSAAVAAGLTDAFGGIEKMSSAVGSYYERFYSDTEKAAKATESLQSQFAALGLSVPASKEEFRALVESIDITTESGRRLAASVIGLAPAFDEASKAAQAAANNMLSALNNWGSSDQVKQFKAQQLQQTLSAGGLNVDMNTIMNSTKESVLAYYNSLDPSSEIAKLLLNNQQSIYDLVNSRAAPATASGASSLGVGGGSGGAAGGLSGVDPVASTIAASWRSAEESIVQAIKDLQQSLIENGPDSFANLQAKFAIELAQAKSGDLTAAQGLPTLARALIESGKLNTNTAVDQARLAAQVVASLSGVAAMAKASADSALATSTSGHVASTYQSMTSAEPPPVYYQDKTLDWLTNQNSSGIYQNSFPGYEYVNGRWQPVGMPQFGSLMPDGQHTVDTDPETGALRLKNLDGSWADYIPRFDVGTNRVPHDMLAVVHKDEAIIPAAYNPALGGNQVNTADLEARLAALQSDMRAAQVFTAGLMSKVSKVLQKWDDDGIPEQREAMQ